MIFPFDLSRAPLGLLALLTLPPHGILARVPISRLPPLQFLDSFNAYPGRGPGGCSRSAPNGVPMLDRVFKSLGGANAIAQTMVQDLPTYPNQTYVRGLLFLFFGITFLEDHSINPIQDGLETYKRVLRRASNELPPVSVLSTDAHFRKFHRGPTGIYPPAFTFRKPRYSCLEDYASYFQHDVGSDGKENMSGPLIAEPFDVKSEPDSLELYTWNFEN